MDYSSGCLERWQDAGLAEDQIALLRSVPVRLADLSGNQLGMVRDGVVLIDRDAAGQAWFIDGTPRTDEEFSSAGSGTLPLAREGIDLLTAMLHEFGHLLGLTDLISDGSDALMTGTLGAGNRRLPTHELVDAFFADHSHDK